MQEFAFATIVLIVSYALQYVQSAILWVPLPKLGQFFLLLGISNFIYIAASPYLTQKNHDYVGISLGIFLFVMLTQSKEYLLVILIPAGICFLKVLLKNNFTLRFGISICTIALLYLFRRRAELDFSVFWFLSYWLKIISLTISKKQTAIRNQIREAYLYFLAPPFFIGPLAFPWLQFSTFQDGFSESPRKTKDAVFLGRILYGMAFLGIATFLISPGGAGQAWSPKFTSETQSWLFNCLAGYIFFLFRFFQFAGLSFLSSAFFRASGIEIKVDFSWPMFARNFSDFWSRYQFYARDFLFEHVFCRITFLPFWGSFFYLKAHIALIGVFAVFGIAQYLCYLPNHYSIPSMYYTFSGCMKHATVAFLLFESSLIIREISKSLSSNLPFYRTFFMRKILTVGSWGITQISIGYFFYSGYWHLWNNLSVIQFFTRMIK